MIQLSIIVPVYNAEQYIRPCLESVFCQGLDEDSYEVIIINDGTTDKSISGVKDIIKSHRNIFVIEQERQGLSVARNTGLERASGKYVLFLDSDDVLIDKCLQKMLFYAMNYEADMIIGDFVKMTDDEIMKWKQGKTLVNNSSTIMYSGKGIDFFLHGYDKQGYVWRVFYKRDFMEKNDLVFVPDLLFEDIPYMAKSLLSANTILKVSLVFYIYRQHQGSIVYSLNKEKMINLNRVMEILWKMRSNPLLIPEARSKLMDIVFRVFTNYKWRLLLNDNLFSDRREIISDLKKRVPDLHFTHSISQLITTLLFRLMPYKYFELRKRMDYIVLWAKHII